MKADRFKNRVKSDAASVVLGPSRCVCSCVSRGLRSCRRCYSARWRQTMGDVFHTPVGPCRVRRRVECGKRSSRRRLDLAVRPSRVAGGGGQPTRDSPGIGSVSFSCSGSFEEEQRLHQQAASKPPTHLSTVAPPRAGAEKTPLL